MHTIIKSVVSFLLFLRVVIHEETLELNICILAIHKLFKDILLQIAWIVFNDADVMHAPAADFDNFSVH